MKSSARPWCASMGVALGCFLATSLAHAQLVPGAPLGPVEAAFPEGAPAAEVRVELEIVVDKAGNVESAVVARLTEGASAAFGEAAVRALRAAKFRPSTRDGEPVRSRLRYALTFHPLVLDDDASANARSGADVSASLDDDGDEPEAPVAPLNSAAETEPAPEVVVRGATSPSARGIGDVRVLRDQLEASPRQKTSEMLSAAPGFFVDHEDGEGFANDVHLRGFDLEHGSGIEMRAGSVPINIPLHIRGQGYADPNFIIPEIVRSVRVLEGPFDPRQGDAAIVGSAYFDLGVVDRGYRLSSSYGSFHQMRAVGIVAPKELDPDTFAAFAFRRTDGFGVRRDGLSASTNAQYAWNIGANDRVRFLVTGYGARSSLAGVVRRDDVEAGRIGLYDAYPYFSEGQSVRSSRVIVGVTYEHDGPRQTRIEVAPWFSWSDFRARQNYGGNLESAMTDPKRFALGDLFETTNRETAAGATARFRSGTLRPFDAVEVAIEPGIFLRAAHTAQGKNLLVPSDLQIWDRRFDAGIRSLNAGAYLDLDARFLRHWRVAGGPRADLLVASVDDHLSRVLPAPSGVPRPTSRDAVGVAPGIRATVEYDGAGFIVPAVSFGQGFRSLAAERILQGETRPFSTVTSVEGGVKVLLPDDRYVTRLAVFETRVGNELVFEATSGGLETQNASVRRGFIGSIVARPLDWLLASMSLSLAHARYATRLPGISHYIPSIPSALFRGDLSARGRLVTWDDAPVTGRVGLGYTMVTGRHLTDAIVGPTYHTVNMSAALRHGFIELGVEVYNLFDSQNPDDEQAYISNWSLSPGQQPASLATHIRAATPRTLLGTVSLYF